jgi:hypothetical protein
MRDFTARLACRPNGPVTACCPIFGRPRKIRSDADQEKWSAEADSIANSGVIVADEEVI